MIILLNIVDTKSHNLPGGKNGPSMAVPVLLSQSYGPA